MGYYTRYELNMHMNLLYDPVKEEEIKKRLHEISGYDNIDDNEIKWYDHEEDMIKLSKEYPDIVFTLDGEGEETGDVWCAYFQNGKFIKHHQTKFVPPAFNVNDLK